jgi:hypothetical protein
MLLQRFLPALAVLLGVGCSGSPVAEKTAHVKGNVSVDGLPLKSGKIIFDAAGVPAAELDIKDGVYAGDSSLGKKTVRLLAFHTASAPEGMAGQPGYEHGMEVNYLQAKYNAASTMTCEVMEGQNEFSFDAKTK